MPSTSFILTSITLLVCFSSIVIAKEKSDDPEIEIWKMKDGSEYKARLLYFDDKKGSNDQPVITALMANENDLIEEISLDSFQKVVADELLKRRTEFPVLGYNEKLGYKFPPAPPTGWQYAGQGKAARSSIPSYNQTDYGFKAGSCLPNSFVNTLAWWDQNKMIEIPQERDEKKQIDWLHTVISREARTRNRGTYWKDLIDGVKDFNETALGGDYRMPCFPVENITPESLALFTQRNWAVCLSVQIYYKNKRSGGHGVTIVSADRSGRVKVNTWGLEIEGKMTLIEQDKKPKWHKGKDYEIVITNREEMPDWFRNDEVRFIMEQHYIPACYVFLPLEKQKAGKKWHPRPKSIIVGELLGIKKPEAKKIVSKRPRREYSIKNHPNSIRISLVDGSTFSGFKVGYQIQTDSNNQKSTDLLVVGEDGVVKKVTKEDTYERTQKYYHRLYCKGAATHDEKMRNYYSHLAEADSYREKYFETFQPRFPPVPVLGWTHIHSNAIERSSFPMIEPERYGVKSTTSVQGAIVNTLVWWHQNDLIKLPDVGSETKLRQILYKMLSPKHSSRNSDRHWEHSAVALQTLGLKSMKAETAFVCYTEGPFLSSESFTGKLYSLFDKHYGVFLTTTIMREGKEPYAVQALPVLDVTKSGEVTVNAWEKKLKCSVKKVTRWGDKSQMETVLVLEVINSGALPDWYKKQKCTLEIRKKNGLTVIVPYNRVKVGATWVYPTSKSD